MPTDQHPQSGRRPNYHRGRRNHDRRQERRPSPAPQSQDSGAQPAAAGADVDQIIKDIKARISQRHGIDLSAQQIQELSARRLEAILDPRTVKPGLLDQLRKAAGAPAEPAPPEPADAFTFEDHTIYDTHNGVLRFFRKLLNPVLKLFFNPNPLSAALNAQAKVNREAARRDAERERTQAEWNALHYTLLQRLVTEISRVSLEMQSLSLRIESLAARADFTERRVRGLESTPAPTAAPQRTFDAPAREVREPREPRESREPREPRESREQREPREPREPREVRDGGPSGVGAPRPAGEGAGSDPQGDGTRRRRRRRRGRRGNVPGEGPGGPVASGSAADAQDADDDGFEDGPEPGDGADETVAAASAAPVIEAAPPVPAAAPSVTFTQVFSAPDPPHVPAPPAATPATPEPAFTPEPTHTPADVPPPPHPDRSDP